jgi:hypothetical protein
VTQACANTGNRSPSVPVTLPRQNMWTLRIDDTTTPESNGIANGFFDVVESALPIGVDSLTGSFF